MQRARSILLKHWGYASFRQGQEEAIENVLAKKNTMVLLPTGGGKSLCFQVPAMILDGVCLVISPLIALMEDQVLALKNKNIKALHLGGNLSISDLRRKLDNVLYGNYKFLYLSPERLQNELVLETIRSLNISLLAIDEAHCISQWGHDFRPAYRKINELAEHIGNPPVIALTATATPIVVQDILQLMKIEDAKLVQNSFKRANLSYETYMVSDKLRAVEQVLKNKAEPAVIYIRSRQGTIDYARHLNSLGIKSSFFHGGLTSEEKNNKLQDWLTEKTPVMIATNAFGMGIDKPNVRHVIHLQIPESIESYFQEAGRAGRDGKPSRAILYYNNYDATFALDQFTRNLANSKFVKFVYQKLNAYFRISYGEGELSTHDFNFSDFCERYKLPISKSYNALRTLDRIGVIQLQEVFGRKCIVQFQISSNALLDYFDTNYELSLIGQRILRLYGGIFEVPIKISIETVAKETERSVQQVIQVLRKMEEDKTINLELLESDVQIHFLVSREDNRTINRLGREIDLLIKNTLDKVKATIDFIDNDEICKSKQLLSYFGEKDSESCMVCSVCIKQTTSVSKSKEVLQANIMGLLQEKGALQAIDIANYLECDLYEITDEIRDLIELNKLEIHLNNYYKVK